MRPDVFSIGGFTLRWYGVFMAAAAAFGYWWATRAVRKRGGGLEVGPFQDAVIMAVVWGIVGARAIYVLTNWGDYAPDPVAVFRIWEGGLSFHGGILGGLGYLWAWTGRRGLPLARAMDVLVAPAAFGVVLGRVGNLMNGSDAAGRMTSWPIGYTWPEWATGYYGVCPEWGQGVYDCTVPLVRGPVHLTQVYGMLVGALLFGLIMWAARTPRPEGWLSGLFVAGYSTLRFVLEEPFRDNPIYVKVWEDPAAGAAMLTLAQLVSIPLAALGFWLMARAKGREASPWTGPFGEADADAVPDPTP